MSPACSSFFLNLVTLTVSVLSSIKSSLSQSFIIILSRETTGVTDIMEVSPKFLAEQLDGIFTDIYPDAVKTGMVASGELIQVIADKLTEYKAGNIVVDPVMVATSGARLISEDAISILKSRLLPLATVITRTFHDRM